MQWHPMKGIKKMYNEEKLYIWKHPRKEAKKKYNEDKII